MKKVSIGFVGFIVLFSLSFYSCKNLFKGSNLINDLNTTIDYINASYVQVTINASNSVVDSITPAAVFITDSIKNQIKLN